MELSYINGTSMLLLLAYGFLIFLYLIILRLLINALQRTGDKYSTQRSIVDRAIHRTMNVDIETSMQALNIYEIAMVIAKGGITAIAMAGIIILSVVKIGILATALLIVIMVVLSWCINHWLKNRERPDSVRSEIRQRVQKMGNVGSIIVLSVALVALLFVMIWIH